MPALTVNGIPRSGKMRAPVRKTSDARSYAPCETVKSASAAYPSAPRAASHGGALTSSVRAVSSAACRPRAR